MQRATRLDDMRTTFGAQTATEAARRARVSALFDRIAPRYDLMNDLMSLGLHRLWKRATLAWARAALQVPGAPRGAVLDLAGGTGDLALALARSRPGRPVVLADASAGMLARARLRAARAKADAPQIVQCTAEDLPFESASMALVTLAFGLRNMTDPAQALREVARVLAPGGQLLLLEFSQPAAWFAPFYGLHARFVIPGLGALIARDRGAYRYLVESIARFPARDDITREITAAGLRVSAERSFMFGIARLHRAIKEPCA